MPRRTHRSVGRPKGPTPGRGHRPYDPGRPTPKRLAMLSAIYGCRRDLANDRIRLCELAEYLGTSISYLTITKNSPWGQQVLRSWAIAGGEDPDQFDKI